MAQIIATGKLATYTVTLYSPDRARVESVEDFKVNNLIHRVKADVTYQPARENVPAHVSVDYGYQPVQRLTGEVDRYGHERTTDPTDNARRKVWDDINAAVLPVFRNQGTAGMAAALERAAERADHERGKLLEQIAELQKRADALNRYATERRALACNVQEPELMPVCPTLDHLARASWDEQYRHPQRAEAFNEARAFGYRAGEGMDKEYLLPARAVIRAIREANPPTRDVDTASIDELEAAAVIVGGPMRRTDAEPVYRRAA